ncbi:hypothetical protein PHET_04188 [Paragonimus heterotremus]|uniref:VWFA domain-containing protein n=1 Tax=Paragonimus heterotremus TaxID=100268 RepID=A0A8J4SNL8_9TREM|nr:hypothetical protein PHET_04188 [Paragonimus heterotremus]
MWDIQYDENRLDFFDCRSQPWYLSASSYTKEMLILVDKSGSMKGRSDIISNATVAEILNTLTENDFFNIIMTREQRPDAQHCNRALMIITDSVPASYQELFDQYNPEKDVRVFVYLLGQHSSAEPYVEELACYNRGYAVTIATLADVKENVLDTMIASKEEEPVMYTSVAEAVYDETKRAKRLQQGILLGVAGIDVPIQSFRDALRGWEHKSILKSYYQNVDLNEVEIPHDVKINPIETWLFSLPFTERIPKHVLPSIITPRKEQRRVHIFRQYSSQHYNIPIPMTMIVSRDVERVPMAVVGLQLTHHHLQSIFDRITNTCLSEPCETWSGLHAKRYLISQAALVLASSGGEKEHFVQLISTDEPIAHPWTAVSPATHNGLAPIACVKAPLSKNSVTQTGDLLVDTICDARELIDSIWQGNIKSDEIQNNPLDQYETKDRYGSSRNGKSRNGYYDPYEYKSSPEALAVANLESHNTVRTVDEELGSDLQMPPLPPLVDEATELKNSNFSDTNPTPNVTFEPELMEEPSDEIFGKMDQDPYEAQLRALAAIEACRQEQSALLQPHFEQDLESNFTESNNTHEADAVSSRMPIPGSLLDCVQKSVQQRCRLGSGTSSFTGRYACEAVCELIRERMPQLVNKLEDCKQPLIACTERFTVFHVLPPPPEDISSSFGKNADIASYTGEYCQECGTRRWWLRPIIGTNLFLLVDYSVPGASSGPCGCNCQKRFRYGVQITNILFNDCK